MKFVLEGILGKPAGKSHYWSICVPLLEVYTQGKSRADAFSMIKEAVEVTAGGALKVKVHPCGDHFWIESDDDKKILAIMLRRKRQLCKLSLAQVAAALKKKSINSYARYEQGKVLPKPETLLEILAILSPAQKPLFKLGVAS